METPRRRQGWVSPRIPLSCITALLVSLATSAGAESEWIGRAQQDIATREYEVSWQERPGALQAGHSWQAPNRAHGLRAYFLEQGIEVVPRTGTDPSWTWSLTLVGYGRGATLWPVSAAGLAAAGNRIDYRRGTVDEWYVNDDRGLKQGFHLWATPEEVAQWDGAAPLPGHRAAPGRSRRLETAEKATLVHLDLALGGNLMPVISTDGQAIDFVIPGGARALRYAELVVTDATGRQLPSWMEGVTDDAVRGIRLVVDDREAVYPIVVDPLATSPAWQVESDQGGALFGYRVGTAGDVNGDGYADVIVGAYAFDAGQTNEGRAFVYLGSASGLATTSAWTAENDLANTQFGAAVGTAGDVNGDGYADVIVGANQVNGGQAGEGRAYVYLGSAAGLSTTPAWTAESNQANALFGSSVGTAGDVNGDGYSDVIVGAFQFDNQPADNEGSAFAYLGSAAGLATTPAWVVTSGTDGALFGYSVGTAGDVNGDGYADVIVGAYQYTNGEASEGRAYAYLGSAAGLSTTPAWTVESNSASAQLGHSVLTAGDVNGDGYADVIVGAPGFDNQPADNEGSAFAYLGSAAGLATTPAWTVGSGTDGAQFGSAVGTAGDVNGDGYADVIVGASQFTNGEALEGQVSAYFGSAAGLSLTSAWTVESNAASAQLGVSVGTAGDVNGDGYADVIAGAYGFDNAQTDEGQASTFLGSAAGLSTESGWTAESNQASASFGAAVGTAGDVNGDGYADVIVGASHYDNGQVDEGRAWVYLGSAAGLSTTPAWTAEINQAGALFGYSVGTAGDVNGDGYADVVVGAYAFDSGQTDEGRAYVYLGSAAGLSTTPAWTVESNSASAQLGVSVGTAGDVNGDGYADVIAGANGFDNGQADEGRAYVYLGSAAGLSTMPAWTVESNSPSAQLGASVGTAGDVNGDGYADVIVGAPGFDGGSTDEGLAYVYLGSAAGLSTSPPWFVMGSLIAQAGASVGTAGDVNGDGYADVIVGMPGVQSAIAYQGSPTGLSLPWFVNNPAFLEFGRSVGTAGDVNGDGYADVIVGAGAADRAVAYLGSAAGLSTAPAWTEESGQEASRFGHSVGTAGDVNGDGYADVIVGANFYSNGQGEEGRAFVYHGNGTAGLSIRPRQRRADDLAPIAPGGRSRIPGSFRVAALGRSPFGRAAVRLEVEAKGLEAPFDGTGTLLGADWEDTSTAGAALGELVSGLEPGRYRWRARFRYDPASSPFQQASRWFTVPWNGWHETDVIVGSFLGGVVWEDRDRDGIREVTEPRLWGVVVQLLDSGGTALEQTTTDSQGGYSLEIPDEGDFRLRFVAPTGYLITLRDQGSDDALDSDANTVTGQTALIAPPHQSLDADLWGAGMYPQGLCFVPDEPLYIGQVTLSPEGFPILHFQDGNQPSQVTGYNVYRSSDAGAPFSAWSLEASNVLDMDQATPNKQWVDTSGDESPSSLWFYQVNAYNSVCDAEGPN